MHLRSSKAKLITIAGGLIGGFFATNLGRSTIAGIEGWRCAFHLVALVSLITSGLTLWLAVDPRRKLAVRLSLDSTRTPRQSKMHDGCTEGVLDSSAILDACEVHQSWGPGLEDLAANRSPPASPCDWPCS